LLFIGNRHDFDGEIISSPTTGKMITYFPKSVKRRRIAWSSLIIVLAILFVIACVSLLFFIKLSMANAGLEDFGNVLIPILNAVQVQVLNEQYKSLALYLNKNENHRTDTEYEDSLILKLFAFQFVNSYAALFYIAFIKEYMGKATLTNNYVGSMLT
jgi:anoctamin-10